MTKKPSPARPAIAAIAAVIVLSATPAFAQIEVPSQPTWQPAPVIAPVVPMATPAPAPPAAAPQPIAAPRSNAPVLALPTVDVEAQQQAVRTETEPAARPVRQASASQSAPAARPSSQPAPAPTVMAETDATGDQIVQNDALAADESAMSDGAVASAPAESTQASNTNDDDALVWAALAGALGLGAVGGGIVLTRRRRKDGIAADPTPRDLEPEGTVATPDPVAEPAMAAAAAPMGIEPVSRSESMQQRLGINAIPAKYVSTNRPVGYYESMVDEGPTAENPFLTRSKRLVRARFLDKQIAKSAEQRRTSPAQRPVRTRELEPA